jgi:hypothetical protein
LRALRSGVWVKRWYVYSPGQERRKTALFPVYERTLQALLRKGLIECHETNHAYRLTSAGRKALRELEAR